MKLSVSVTALLFLGIICLSKADEIDPKVILQKSAEATSQLKSYKADMLIESFASLAPQKGVIYQKKQPDGTMTMRMEMNLLNTAVGSGATNNTPTLGTNYTLISSQGAYTVMGNKALKMDGMPGMDKLKDIMNPDALKKATEDAQSAQVNYTLTNGVVDARECWVISIPTSPATLDAVKKAMSQGAQKELLAAAKMRLDAIPMPVKMVISIDKQTYLIAKQESLDSNNIVISSTTFQNAQPNVEVSDQLFKLPDNINIENMNSIMQNALKTLNSTK